MKQIYVLTTILLLTCINIIAQTTDVVTGLSFPQGIVLNGNDLYIAENNGNKISKIDITDATPTTIDVVTGLNGPRQLLLNGNDLYIAEYNGNKISKIDITDATPTTTDVVTVSRPGSIMLVGNEMYIADAFAGKVSRIDITDTTPTTTDVVTGLDVPAGIALKDNILYISEIVQSKIVSTQITLSLNENLFTEKIKIFPNPSSDFIQFTGLIKKENYKIFNSLGSIIRNGTISNQEEIDIRSLTTGLYFFKFDNGNTIKFIKE
ncbi:MAG: T9SS type A sorting domain-containing protein [Winogradskyella sp.]|uniref:T9SS type A sorting domain-containing protein n=1 Tax=Winogradskyella sp. TaxID=1883156 RepID=UPI0025F1EEEC|nr:T9SS type A sorting domain-containing protein [Winogradskyella sp.]NRB84887.1 T9SS type A sorting domain-containing protein [Winogradskyella sp.]